MKGTAFKPEPSVSISVWKNGLQMFLRILPEMLDKKNTLIFYGKKLKIWMCSRKIAGGFEALPVFFNTDTCHDI
jgi:hypothetical protein